jgi:hypothetical protein
MAPIDCSGVAPAAGHSWFCKFCRIKHESKVRPILPNHMMDLQVIVYWTKEQPRVRRILPYKIITWLCKFCPTKHESKANPTKWTAEPWKLYRIKQEPMVEEIYQTKWQIKHESKARAILPNQINSWFWKFCRIKHESKVREIYKTKWPSEQCKLYRIKQEPMVRRNYQTKCQIKQESKSRAILTNQ